MTDIIQKEVEQYTAISTKKSKSLITTFGKVNCLVQTEIMKEQSNQYHRLKNRYGLHRSTSLCALLLAINKYVDKEKSLNKKDKSQNLSSLDTDFVVRKFHKLRKKEKREKLLNCWSTVTDARRQGHSWRRISEIIRSIHRFDISHTYIRNTWEEIKNG